MLKIYLAGPDVFLENAAEVDRRKQVLCMEHGFEGLSPIGKDESVEADPAEIFRINCDMMRAADIGLFNLTPFRGPSADAGTVFELGFMFSQGKPVFGYAGAPALYAQRVNQLAGPLEKRDGKFWDRDNFLVENFDFGDNLMIARSIEEAGGYFIAIEESGADAASELAAFTAFEACLKAAKQKIAADAEAAQADA